MTHDVAITGLGNAGIEHVAATEANDSAELVAVCDVDESRLEEVDVEGVETYTDHARMLDAEDPDLVSVCTPPPRKSLVEAAGERGVAVLVEKPTATTVAALDELIRVRDEYGIPVSATRNVAYFPALQQAQEHVASGGIGEVTAVDFTWSERRPSTGSDIGQESWVSEFETGVIAEMVSHPVYCALTFTDELAGEVAIARRDATDDPWPEGVSI